jgi:undecaprenyl diphosphate synthase
MSDMQAASSEQVADSQLLGQLDPDLLPRHVAIIMDGNGRWAAQRGLPRMAGHRQGLRALQEVLETCQEVGVPNLTIYAFSYENWNRPLGEINMLMDLLKE